MNIGGNDDLFIGEDKNLDLEVLDDDDVPVNVTGWAVTFDMREKPHSPTTMVSLTCSVEGTYSATRALNTQRLRAALTDDHTTKFEAGRYAYSFKLTTAGAETILAQGGITFQEATQK